MYTHEHVTNAEAVAHTHPHGVTRPYEDLRSGMLFIAAWPLAAPSAVTKVMMEPSLKAFLAAWIRHFRHFFWKEKLITYPRVAGYPRALGLYERVGDGRVGSSSLIARVGSGTGSPFMGTGRVRYVVYLTRRQP